MDGSYHIQRSVVVANFEFKNIKYHKEQQWDCIRNWQEVTSRNESKKT